jgi:hypothetical protein
MSFSPKRMKSVNAIMPGGKCIRRVQFDEKTNDARWNWYRGGKPTYCRGYVVFSVGDGEPEFFFSEQHHHLEFVARYVPRRNTYRDRTRKAVRYRSVHQHLEEKVGEVWS